MTPVGLTFPTGGREDGQPPEMMAKEVWGMPMSVTGDSRAIPETLARLAEESGASFVATAARALQDRIREGLFYVACLGQFKRGKSTLVNALVGERILPVGVVPVTAVVTVVRYGEDRCARVCFRDGRRLDVAPEDLADYVSEGRNPENQKGVEVVEVLVPSPLLKTGMCLVDTPGVGSVFGGNTETTKAFVPHVDAALVVVGSDPPIGAEELDLVKEVASQNNPDAFAGGPVGGDQRLLVVLNKADRVLDRDRAEAIAFTRRVLKERAGLDGIPVFEVSAKERLEGRGLERDWPALVAALKDLAERSGASLVEAAQARGVTRLAGMLLAHLDERRDMLLQPVEESGRRVEALRAFVAEAERSLGDLEYLCRAEEDRLGRSFTAIREEFLSRSMPAVRDEFSRALREARPRRGPALRREAIRVAHEVSRRWLDRFRAELTPRAEALYVQAMQRFADLVNAFLKRLQESAGPLLPIPADEVSPESGFRVRSRMHYASLMAYTSQGPVGWLADIVRTRSAQIRTLEEEMGEYLHTLLFANANRIESDLDDRVAESRRRFIAEVRSALTMAVEGAEAALRTASEIRAQGSESVAAEVARLEALRERVKGLVPSRT